MAKFPLTTHFLLKSIVLLLLVLSFQVSNAQSPIDTLPRVHSVKRATNLSAILPGAGQVYNHKIWKVPIIYAAFGGMAYLIKFNNDNYKKFNGALITRLDGDSTTIDNYVNRYTDANLLTLSNYYHRNRDLSIIVTSLIYVLNIIDAHVDAHLYTFDVDDNLSLQVTPTIIANPFTPNAAAVTGLNFNFRF